VGSLSGGYPYRRLVSCGIIQIYKLTVPIMTDDDIQEDELEDEAEAFLDEDDLAEEEEEESY